MKNLLNMTYSLRVAKYYFEIQQKEKQQFMALKIKDTEPDYFFDVEKYAVSLDLLLRQNDNGAKQIIKEQKELLNDIKALWEKVRTFPTHSKQYKERADFVELYGTLSVFGEPIKNIYVIKNKDNVRCVGFVQSRTKQIVWIEWDSTDKKQLPGKGEYRFYFDFDKLPQDEQILPYSYPTHVIIDYCNKINEMIDGLSELCKESAPPQRTIDNEKLKTYFKPDFSYFSLLLSDLEKEQVPKRFAEIALMIYESRTALNRRKPPTFEAWYKIFCECVGCEKKTYQANKLRNPPPSIKSIFSYL